MRERLEYILNPGCWVGTIQLPSADTVRITEAAGVARPVSGSHALNPKDWRDEQAPFKEARDLVEAMAHAFVSALEKALRRGLHGYRLTENPAKTVRGRILLRSSGPTACG